MLGRRTKHGKILEKSTGDVTKSSLFEKSTTSMNWSAVSATMTTVDTFMPAPKLLTILDDNEEDGDETDEEEEFLQLEQHGASGRWSTLSWSSLYERGTESSLSWADDELERDATEKVRSIFNKIDAELYNNDEPETCLDPKHETYQLDRSRFDTSRLPKEIKEECDIWRNRFPHLRVIGKSIPKLKTEIISPEVPKNAGKVFRKSKTKPTTSSLKDDAREVAEAEGSKDDQDEEEIIASHGTYRDPDRNFGSTSIGHGLQVDWVLNDKFEADPKKYLEDKLLDTLFKKIWISTAPTLQPLVDRFSLHLIEQNMEDQSNNFWSFENAGSHYLGGGYRMSGFQFDSIDENLVLTGLTDLDLDDRPVTSSKRVTSSKGVTVMSPVSDMNPVSLPNLRPVPASAPVVRESLGRPSCSVINDHSPLSQWRRSNSFRTPNTNSSLRTITALGNVSQNGRGGPLRLSPGSEENKTMLQLSTDVKVRLRSKSGSPPLRPPTVTSSRGQPISLPPIFGISGSPNHASALSASTSGYFSLTTPSSRLGSSTLSTPRSLRFDSGKTTPTVPSRPLTSDISISGVRLKKLESTILTDSKLGNRRILSGHAANQWDAKTALAPSTNTKPRFRY